jgi:hypothetical protein
MPNQVLDQNFYDIQCPSKKLGFLFIVEELFKMCLVRGIPRISLGDKLELLCSEIEYLKQAAQSGEIKAISRGIRTCERYLDPILHILEIQKNNGKHSEDLNLNNFLDDLQLFQDKLRLYQKQFGYNVCNTEAERDKKLPTKIPIPPPPPPPPGPIKPMPSERKCKSHTKVYDLKAIERRVPSTRVEIIMPPSIQEEILSGKHKLKISPIPRTPSGTPKNIALPTIVTSTDYLHQELRKRFQKANPVE